MSTAATFSETDRAGDSRLPKTAGAASHNASARAGFMPLSLEHVVIEGLDSIPVYLRTLSGRGADACYRFTLFSAIVGRFSELHRARLRESGVRFIYIPLQEQMRFRRQVEAHLDKAMTDPALALATRSELVYQTSIELVEEVLAEQNLADTMPRLENIAKAVSTLVINDAGSFSHLFAVSQHDFYTATHMVNVGTWMVSLAYALGIQDMQQLNLMCQAGMVHDIGKMFISEELLNKRGRLSDDDWRQLRAHPASGAEHLRKFANIPELVVRVVAEHHERMDGTGYPSGLKDDQILPASRICAVVDSFDAMTSLRPFKTRTESADSALRILQNDAPAKYDPKVVAAWASLMHQARDQGAIPQSLQVDSSSQGRRKHPRFPVQCSARVHRMEMVGQKWFEHPAIQVSAHNVSRGGLGFLSRHALDPSQYVRVHLMGQGTLANKVFEGQIVRCRQYSDTLHEMGMVFSSLDAERKAAEKAVTI